MPQLKSVLILLLLVFVLACRERTLDLHMAPHEPRIVMLANWKAGDFLTVRLLRSLDPFGKVPEDIALPFPTIQVIKDGQLAVAEFKDQGDGLYTSNILLKPSHTYQVLVEHEQYPHAATPAMFIPAVDPSKIDVKRIKDVPGPSYADTHDLYEINLSGLPISAQYCYTVTFEIFFKEGIRTYSWPAEDVASLNEAACHAEERVQQQGEQYHYWLVSPACLDGSKEKLKFYIGTSDNVFMGGNLVPSYAEKVRLKVGVADAGWLSFAQVNNAQPEGIDQLVLSPKLYKSNITNGYGMVTTLHEAVFEYVY